MAGWLAGHHIDHVITTDTLAAPAGAQADAAYRTQHGGRGQQRQDGEQQAQGGIQQAGEGLEQEPHGGALKQAQRGAQQAQQAGAEQAQQEVQRARKRRGKQKA